MKPKVSVIVPCYGVEKYLNRCMDSIINQTLKEIEIILVDDKSPDKVPEMCNEWALKDSRIKIMHKIVNEGLGFARNSGINIASGEYIAFVDSDDFVGTDMYETLYNEAKQSNADVVFSNSYTEGQPGYWRTTQEVIMRTEWRGESVMDFLKDMIGCAPSNKKERLYQMSVWHSIYRYSVIQHNNIRFHSEREILSEDFPFQIDFIKKSNCIVYIPQAFYHYCQNGDSLTNTFNVAKFDRARNLYELMNNQLKNEVDYDDFRLRIDRFYIGYVRARIQDLMFSKNDSKHKWICYACEQLINTGIQDRYPHTKMRIDRLIFYKLMIHKNVRAIELLCTLIHCKKIIYRQRL